MKNCCNTNNAKAQNKSSFAKWFNYLVYAILIAIIGGALVLQILV